MDEALRRYQLDIARAQLSRRRFMTARRAGGDERRARGVREQQRDRGAVGGRSLDGGLGRRRAPRRQPALRREAPSAAAAASIGPLESDLYMFNWSTTSRTRTRTPSRRQFGVPITYDTYPVQRGAAGQAQGGRQGPVRRRRPDRRVLARPWPTAATSPSSTSRCCRTCQGQPRFLHAAVRPERRLHRAQGLGHDRDHLRGTTSRSRSRPGRTSSTSPRASTPARRSSSTRPVTCSSRRCALHGFDINTDKTDELEIARQELMALRPHLQSIDSDNYPDTLRNGDAGLGPRLERDGLPDAAGARLQGHRLHRPDRGHDLLGRHLGPARPGAAPERGLHVPQLDPGPERPGHREPVCRLRELQRRRPRRSCRPSSSNNPAVYVPEDQLANLTVATDQSGNKQRADIWAEFVRADRHGRAGGHRLQRRRSRGRRSRRTCSPASCCCRPASGTWSCSSSRSSSSSSTASASGAPTAATRRASRSTTTRSSSSGRSRSSRACDGRSSGTRLCLLVAFPSPTSSPRAAASARACSIILLVIPFWTSFLIRTIAWLTILGPARRRRLPRRPDRATTSRSWARRSPSSSASSTTTCR